MARRNFARGIRHAIRDYAIFERLWRMPIPPYKPEFWITKRPKERRENNLVAV